MKYKSRIAAIATIILLFLLHLPFLHADPDYFLSIGRDAFTDEGLNTSQLRNYINHGYLDLNECDNMIKTPLFNLLLFFPLKLWGTHLIVARLTILLFLIAVLLFLLKHNYFTEILPLLLISTLTQFYVFQYSHFSLSEMMAVCCIFLGVFFTFRFYEERKNKWLVIAAMFFSFAYYSKVQYAYVVVLLPASIIVLHWLKISSHQKSTSLLLKSTGLLLLFVLVYFLAWYLPFRSTFDYVMKDQTAGKFTTLGNTPGTIFFNVIHFSFSNQTWWFNSLVIICFVMGIILLAKTEDRRFKVLFVLSSLWTIIECHKLAMVYLPSRYLVSYYFAAGFMSSVVIHQLILQGKERKIFFRVGIAITIIFFIANSIQYAFLLKRREYKIAAINEYFYSTLKNQEQPIMGAWAPSATWDCKAQCLGVWKDFMNDKDLFKRFHPQAILSEPDEAESNQAYSSQGIHLDQLADSTRSFEIGRWNVIVYWMK